MWKLMIFVTALQLTCALPVARLTERTMQNQTMTEDLDAQRDILSYIKNFKNEMAGFVNARYNHLTVNDMEEIKTVLEGFLINFARDLRDVLKHPGNATEREAIEDGVPDTTFEDMKRSMKTKFPEIDDASADEIVFRLRKNLLVTRRKIDKIVVINDSEEEEENKEEENKEEENKEEENKEEDIKEEEASN